MPAQGLVLRCLRQLPQCALVLLLVAGQQMVVGQWGVREYQAPVAISNGWGNDKGFSELTADQQERVLELFAWRKGHPTRLKWFVSLPRPESKLSP